MAEIQIYDTERNRPKILPNKYGQKGDKDHGPEKMYDRNVLTSYILSGNETPWGAVEFDKPVNLKEIRFVPRNDGNFIYEGDNYELYYWEKEGWTLLSNIKRYARRCTLCRQCASRYFAAPAQCHTRKRGACLYL